MRGINSISQVLQHVAIALIVILMLLTVSDVFMRFVFNNPITGTAEMGQQIMVCLVLGVAWCAVRGEHVSVDLVMSHASPRIQAIVDIAMFLACLVIYAIITWRAFSESLRDLKFHATASMMLPIPTFPFWVLYTLGIAFLCVVIVALIIQRAKGAAKN